VEIVIDADVVAALGEQPDECRADKSGPTGNEGSPHRPRSVPGLQRVLDCPAYDLRTEADLAARTSTGAGVTLEE
jgi:hypothetical protein